MPRTLSPEAVTALRAQIAFLRDLGVYDFYRRDMSAHAGDAVGDVLEIAASDAIPDSIPEPTSELTSTLPSGATVAAVEDATVSHAGQEALLTAVPEAALPVPSRRKVATAAQTPDSSNVAAAVARPALIPPANVFPGMEIPAPDRAAALTNIRAEIGDCTRCPLAFEGRHTIVYGDGSPNARILFVGEGPGADEDAQGVPFVGKAGQLLNNMITAMGLKRDEVYIANIVKCRPPQNRVPEPEEANTCTPFLMQQIGVVRPQVIVALGATAATYLLGARSPLSALRGRVHPVLGTRLIVTYHPAFLLRDPSQKKEAWSDLQLAMRELAAAGS